VSGLSRLGRIYQGEAARLLDTYPNARAQGQLHSLDDMIVKNLAHTTRPRRDASCNGR